MGDLNWNFYDKNCPGYKWINIISDEFDIVQHIRKPTRITLKSGSIIDLMLSNINNVYKAGCIDFMVSDHHPTYLIKKRDHVTNETTWVYKRNMASFDRLGYQLRLKQLDWSILHVIEDINL